MFKPFKGFNSKGFLLLYLVVIVIMLMLWFSRLELSQADTRKIPDSLAAFLVSPARSLPQFLLASEEKRVFTNQSFSQHWSFVYFTNPSCRPECTPVLAVLENLKQYFAAQDIQFLLINFDTLQKQSASSLTLDSTLPLYSGDETVIDKLTQAFDFLYLRNRFERGYSLEQQHAIYLVDPKGRVYARFELPFTSQLLQQRFFAIRQFYARSE